MLILLITGSLGQKGGRGVARGRAGKNLRNTFPFNSNQKDAHHEAHHHEEHHAHHEVDATRASRQRGRGGGDDVALDIGSIAAA